MSGLDASRSALVAYVDGVALRGPGLDGWTASIDVLAGATAHVPAATLLVAPQTLPAAERRRVGKGVKIALDVAFAALADAGVDPSTAASVFASSSGDGDNCDAICRELAGDRMISPTRFHNSVHNAPSGYFGIASGSMQPSTSLCAYDDSFVAGLEDALTQLAGGLDAILLVAYDAPYPDPLDGARPTPDCFAVGLVLRRAASDRSIARITAFQDAATSIGEATLAPALEALRSRIPAARALPLLAALAGIIRDTSCGGNIVIEGQDGVHRSLSIDPVRAMFEDVRRAACA